MDITVLQYNQKTIIQCRPGDHPVCAEADALELVALCGENETPLLLLSEGALCDDFFRLRTGVAGQVMLKFSIYHLKVAAVVPPERVKTGKFEDFAIETNRGEQFRIFPAEEAAIDWLVK